MAHYFAELQKVWPDCSLTTLGQFQVVQHRMSVPAHEYVSLILETDNKHLIELTARDSYNEQLAQFLLQQASQLGLPDKNSHTIKLVDTKFPPPWSFSALIIVPPIVAERFDGESNTLSQVTYWILPAYEGEFDAGSDAASFWHQLRRKDGWRSVVVNWDRQRKTRPIFDA